MRMPLLLPADLTPEQQALYGSMRAGIARGFSAFKVIRDDGALEGPWNAYLQEPTIGKSAWELTEAINQIAILPKTVREIAILLVGARYNCAFAIYAHVAVSESLGMPLEHLATICAALKPTNLGADENLAYDIAHSLCAGGTLPQIALISSSGISRSVIASLGVTHHSLTAPWCSASNAWRFNAAIIDSVPRARFASFSAS
jgi:4-carboxymuconolactone decarboxylase